MNDNYLQTIFFYPVLGQLDNSKAKRRKQKSKERYFKKKEVVYETVDLVYRTKPLVVVPAEDYNIRPESHCACLESISI